MTTGSIGSGGALGTGGNSGSAGGAPRPEPSTSDRNGRGAGATIGGRKMSDTQRLPEQPAPGDRDEQPTQPTPPGPPTAGPLQLDLRASPDRTLLADGRDTATVQLWAAGQEPAGDVRVRIYRSGGALSPEQVVIPRGEPVGEAKLTSDRPGDVVVEVMGAVPEARAEPRKLVVHFGAPVAKLLLTPHPARISLVDDADLVVRLLDAEGKSVATDEPRTVELTLDEGRGEIQQKQLHIAAGASEARTRFLPTGLGHITVAAASTSMFTQQAKLDVALPIGLLVVSVTGGLVGGLLAWVRRRHKHVQRIVTGGVTGFILFWAFVIGLVPVLPRAVVLNPLSVFALSTIGGWLGTEVFTILLRRLGLAPEAKKAGHKEDSEEKKEDAAEGKEEPAAAAEKEDAKSA